MTCPLDIYPEHISASAAKLMDPFIIFIELTTVCSYQGEDENSAARGLLINDSDRSLSCALGGRN